MVCRNLGFACLERDANPIVHTHCGLAKPRFCFPRTRFEPYGAHSFWVGETLVLHSEIERRTVWGTLLLGWRNLSFAFPERDASPHGAHSSWVGETYVLHSQNDMRSLRCTLILACRNPSFAFPERDANPMVHTHSGLTKPRFCVPRTEFEPYGAHSFWIAHTHAELATPNFCNPRTRYILRWQNQSFAFPAREQTR